MTRDGPLGIALLAIAAGAALGAWLRWGLAYWLNPRVASLPLGTLAANLIGGYLIGLAVGAFASHPSLSPAWRLFIVTGFLGGLTTFSAFSAENVALLQTDQWLASTIHVLAHVVGSLLATAAGIASVRALGV
jgi:CrcB protein